MKRKSSKSSVRISNEPEIRKILDFYEAQSDDEAAKEIETAPSVQDAIWLQVPMQVLPQVKKLIAKHRKNA